MAAEDGRARLVFDALADLHSRTNYLVDLVDQVGQDQGVAFGYSFDVTSIGTLTITSSGATGASPQAVTPAVLQVVVNEDPAIFLKIGKRDNLQLLGGGGKWAAGVARDAMMQFKTYLDLQLTNLLIGTTAFDTSATYHDNAAAATLTAAMFLQSKAKLLQNDGSNEENIACFVNPMFEASIHAIVGFTENSDRALDAGDIGVPMIGRVAGVPIFMSNSVPASRTVAGSASAIASNVLTITVAAGHGVVPGVKITTSGGDANITTAAAVSSVTATTIVAPLTSADDAANQAVTVTVYGTENIMCDRRHIHVAQQLMPGVRIVEESASTNDSLQIFNVWGKNARVGRTRIIHGPPSIA